LSEVKEQRKRNLLAIRSEIASSLHEMEQKEVAHAAQIEKLQLALAQLSDKHKAEIGGIQDDAANADHLIDIEIQRVSEQIERYRKELYKADSTQSQRMSEASGTIEMLKSEISASNDRYQNMREEMEQTQGRLSQLEQDLLVAEERSQILTEQLAYSEEQKRLTKIEIGKLDRSLWNNRKTRLLRSE
jgi:predicted  nucleic acid-binding Zn-ribbon protein